MKTKTVKFSDIKKDPTNRLDAKHYTKDAHGNIFSGCVDQYNKPVVRTKEQYPYSYDGFVVFRDGENEEVNDSCYSDRLFQQDYAKYNRLCMKHFKNEGQSFSNRAPYLIEKFLRDWYGAPKLKLVYIMEHCNISSGYPLWSFHVNTNR